MHMYKRNPQLLQFVVRQGLLEDAPLQLLQMGLAPIPEWPWTLFDTALRSVTPEVQAQEGNPVDFIRIDAQLADAEGWQTAARLVERGLLLGAEVNRPFAPDAPADVRMPHEIGRKMAAQGLSLLQLATASRTTGDRRASFQRAVFLRASRFWDQNIPLQAVLKLACLYELHELDDWAAELISSHGPRLASVYKPQVLLAQLNSWNAPDVNELDRDHWDLVNQLVAAKESEQRFRAELDSLVAGLRTEVERRRKREQLQEDVERQFGGFRSVINRVLPA